MTKEELEKEAKEYARKEVYYGAYVDDEVGMEIAEEAYLAGATEATKKFESCLEDTIKGKNPFPNICWKLICDANDKLIEQKTKLEKENARLNKAISDLEEKWQRFEELSKEMR